MTATAHACRNRRPRQASTWPSTSAGFPMKNPVTVASGTFAAGREYADFVDVAALGRRHHQGRLAERLGGQRHPRASPRRLRACSTPSACRTPASQHLKDLRAAVACRAWAQPTIVNVSGHSFDEYVQVIEALEDAPVDAYEVNISCPNVDAGGMTIGTHVESASRRWSACCRAATEAPAHREAHAQRHRHRPRSPAPPRPPAPTQSRSSTRCIGMAIDADRRCPTLTSRAVGGFSGPGRQARGAAHACGRCHNAVNVPLLGMGGISNGDRRRGVHARRRHGGGGGHRELRQPPRPPSTSSTASPSIASVMASKTSTS